MRRTLVDGRVVRALTDAMRRFARDVAHSGVRRVLQVELAVHPEHWRETLRGSGMLIVNPPYGLVDEVPQWLGWLWDALSPGAQGGWHAHWLVPE